jgi:hypothetical protein
MAAPRILRVSASTTILMTPCVSPFSMARPTLVIGRRPAGRTGLRLRQADAAKRGVDVKRAGADAIAQAARGAVEEVRRDDLEVVVRGVGEGAAAVAVVERPNAGDVRGEEVVHRDVAVFVDGDAGAIQLQIVGIGCAADREQHMRSGHLGRPVDAIDIDADALVVWCKAALRRPASGGAACPAPMTSGPEAAPMAAPASAPDASRAPNCTGTVRWGVEGS